MILPKPGIVVTKPSGLDLRSLLILSEADGRGQPLDIGSHLLVLFSLALGIEAKAAVEIGVRGGNSTLALLAALEKTGGRLLSIDIEACQEAGHKIARLGLSDRWTFMQTSSDAAIGTARTHAPFDLAFIDGNHSYAQCRKDFDNYSVMAPGGFVVFHDAIAFPNDVGKVVAEIRAAGKEVFTFPYCNGLTIVRT